MKLAELIALQATHECQDRHLVYVGEDGFRIAHTDDERGNGWPLTDCELHHWLRSLDEAPCRPGVYSAYRDETGQSAEDWDLVPFNAR